MCMIMHVYYFVFVCRSTFLKHVKISARMFSILRKVVPKASLRGNEAT